MSKQDVEMTLVIVELQKIFSLRNKLKNRVHVIKFFAADVYIDRDGYFIEWNEVDIGRKTIKEIVSIFSDLNYKSIESVRKDIEEVRKEIEETFNKEIPWPKKQLKRLWQLLH